ncbi:MAG: MMPL family transporter [Pseudomonadales bacterium]|nr:MMPL family transporter [Pseudomonadales bacterium]
MSYPLGSSILKLKNWGLLFTVLVVASFGVGVKDLEFTNNYRVFFSDQNPQLQDFDRFQDVFGNQDNILIAIEAKGGNIFSQDILALINDYTQKAWQTPFSKRVDSLANYQHTYSEEDDLVVEPLVDENQDLTPDRVNEIRDIAMADPILVGMLVSKKGHVAGINITMNLEPDAGADESIAIAYARQLASDMESENANIRTYLSGQTVLNAAFLEAGIEDSMTLIPAMFLLIIAVTYLFLRSFWGTVGTLAVVSLSCIVAFGAAGYLGITQTNVTAMVPIIILTLGVADSIHLLITYYQEIDKGKPKNDAMLEALRINMQPIFLTTLTTVIGFLSLNFSEIPPFRDMGNMVAIGALAAWFFSVVALPVFIVILPTTRKKSVNSGKKDNMGKLFRFVQAYRSALLVFFVTAIIVSSVYIPKIEFNDLFVEYFDESMTFRADNDFIAENLTGVMALQYSVSADKKRGIYQPDYLNQLDAFSRWFETQEEVLYVSEITTVLKRLNKNLHNDELEYYRIPSDHQSAAQYMFLYELSLPYGLDLSNTMDIDRSTTRLSVIIKNTTSPDVIALAKKAQDWAQHNAPALTVSNAVGPSIMFSHISERNLPSMVQGLVLAIVLISIVLLVALKSLKLGLLSLIPNLCPAILTYGIWAIFVGELGMTGITITVISLGIIVDNTVHFLSKYLRAKQELNKSVAEAIEYAFKTVGVALGVTTTILVLGFVILGFSQFQPNTVLGQLTAISLTLSLLISYFLLPPLLFLFESDDPLEEAGLEQSGATLDRSLDNSLKGAVNS